MSWPFRTYLAGVLAVLLAAELYEEQQSGETPTESGVLDVGYSRYLFYNVDINDARAATKVWVQGLIDKVNQSVESKTMVLNDLDSVVQGLHSRQLDLVVLLSSEYLRVKDRIRHEVALVPMAAVVIGDEVEQRYVLLAHRDSGLERLDQLRGKTLILTIGGKGNVPQMWMDVLLLSNGLSTSATFFDRIREVSKVSQAVLPVFFRQDDVCVTPLDTFDTMTELNPQLGEELEVIRTSPGFCQAVVCARKDIYEKDLERFLEEGLLSLHTEPYGQQLLTLFHVDRLVPFDPAYLESVAALVEEYSDLQARSGGEN